MKEKVIIIGFILILLSMVLSLVYVPSAQTPTNPETPTNTTSKEAASQTNPSITLDTLKNGDRIQSPQTITGVARGWYFEGSFPVKIENSQGQTIFTGKAQAQSDWMTTNPVPFTVSITFPTQSQGSTGIIIFMKDNPSGDSDKDEKYSIPIIF